MAATDDPEREAEPPTVSATSTSPERIVFSEDGNTDGWIATDTTVELKR